MISRAPRPAHPPPLATSRDGPPLVPSTRSNSPSGPTPGVRATAPHHPHSPGPDRPDRDHTGRNTRSAEHPNQITHGNSPSGPPPARPKDAHESPFRSHSPGESYPQPLLTRDFVSAPE